MFKYAAYDALGAIAAGEAAAAERSPAGAPLGDPA
jgi:hypothetical protein